MDEPNFKIDPVKNEVALMSYNETHERRMQEIKNAVFDTFKTGLCIPIVWIKEYNSLLLLIKDLKPFDYEK